MIRITQKIKTYKTIYCDPPWMEKGGGGRGANFHYSLIKTKDLMTLDVQKLVGQNAHLYLWVTNNFLQDGLKIMKSWGFRYITKITWIKSEVLKGEIILNNPGLGYYFRGLDEICLFGVKGSLPKRKPSTTVLFAPRRKHSEKPLEMYERIERVSHPPYIELFARKKINEKWDVWGNEVDCDIDFKLWR